MQIKWKIYYWCSLYLVVWSVYVFIDFIVEYLLNTKFYSKKEQIIYSLSIIFTLLVISKGIISLKLIGYFRNRLFLSKTNYRIFIVSFITNFVLIAVLAREIYLFIHYLLFSYGTDHLGVSVKVGQSLMVILLLPCLYILIFDFPLVKAIRRQFNASIDTIGQQLHP